MKIDIVKVGRLETNCYILDKEGKVLVVDPGDDYEEIEKVIGNREVEGVIITHDHFDHVGALDLVVNRYGCKVYRHNNLIEGENKIGEFVFRVIYTPGHKNDLITIYFEEDKMMFCGDFLFKDGVGRCDLEEGDVYKMRDSIIKMREYDRDIILYPGHGDKTILGVELANLEDI